MSCSRRVAIPIAAILAAVACGSDAPVVQSVSPGDTVAVDMLQNSYSVDEVRLSQPGRIVFAFDNADRAGHEAFIGTAEEQERFAELEDESNSLELGRYQQGELEYTFDSAGTYVVGCHIARHYENGMLFTVVVS